VSKSLQEIKKGTIDIAEKKIFEMQENNEINLPEDYSVGNALKSAWLKLQETKDKSGKPVLQSCTRTSIMNALLDTAVQGLNPSKDQVYYIAYGNKLSAMRSYFGNIALAKRVANVREVNAAVIYKGDKVKIDVVNGNRKIKAHETSWDNQNDDNVQGGYVIISFNDDRPDRHTIMTLEECKQAWKQGKIYKENGGSPHNKFTAEMVKKTIINRATKPLIKGSSDSYLFRASVDRSADISTEHDVNEQIEEEANSSTIDIKPVGYDEEEEVEDDTEEVEEEQQEETAEEIYEGFDEEENDKPF